MLTTRSGVGRRMALPKTVVFIAGLFAIECSEAQEVPEFGSATGSAIEPDPERRPIPKPRPQPEPDEEGLSEVVVTSAVRYREKPTWKLTMVPASTTSDDRQVIGLEMKAARGLNEFSLRYASVDPDGTRGPYDQGRIRVRRTLYSLEGALLFDGLLQLTHLSDTYMEPSAQFNVSYSLNPKSVLTVSAGWARRDPDSGPVVEDTDLSIAIKRTLRGRWKVALSYRFENEISKADNFGVGLEWGPSLRLLVEKNWVTTLSYIKPLSSR